MTEIDAEMRLAEDKQYSIDVLLMLVSLGQKAEQIIDMYYDLPDVPKQSKDTQEVIDKRRKLGITVAMWRNEMYSLEDKLVCENATQTVYKTIKLVKVK